MALSDKEIDEVLEAIETHFAPKLTVWEEEFVENISTQWQDKRFLTPGQRQKLDEIWESFATGRRQ